MSPFGPFYCVFRWNLSKFGYPSPSQTTEVRIRSAPESETGSAAEEWYEGLGKEEGFPWANYLKKWTPTSAGKWFLDSKKRLGAKMLIV